MVQKLWAGRKRGVDLYMPVLAEIARQHAVGLPVVVSVLGQSGYQLVAGELPAGCECLVAIRVAIGIGDEISLAIIKSPCRQIKQPDTRLGRAVPVWVRSAAYGRCRNSFSR